MSINKIMLIGRVGNNPEVTYLDNGIAVAKFSLATSDVYKNKSGEKVENTTWHNIVLWRSLAEVAEKYVTKGALLYIEGKQLNKSYTDKDGVKKYTSEVSGDVMKMLGSKKDEHAQATSHGTERDPANTAPLYNQPSHSPDPFASNEIGTPDSDLPF